MNSINYSSTIFKSVSSNLSFVENSPVTPLLFDAIKKCTKITCIAIAILSAFTAAVYIYRYFKAQIEQPRTPYHSDYLLAMSLQEEEVIDDAEEEEEEEEKYFPPYSLNFSNAKPTSIPAYRPMISLLTLSATPPPPLARVKDDSPFEKINDICAQIEDAIFRDTSFSAVAAFNAVYGTRSQAEDLIDEIVGEFERRYSAYITFDKKIKYYEQVPEYDTNVKDERCDPYQKYLGLVGIRNLLFCGSSVIDDFRDERFIGGEHHYAPNKGLNVFKYYTGNVLNLDTELEIENDNDVEAIRQAQAKIIKFGQLCGLKNENGRDLTAEDVAHLLPNRKLHLPNLNLEPIYDITGHHLDCNNHGIWKCGSHYYVNVPNPSIVILATIRLPYLMADLLYRTKQKDNIHLLQEFYDDFFAQGLSDRCFNDKAYAFINFYHYWIARLEGVLNYEEEAYQKVVQGTFGPYMQMQGLDAIRSALTRVDLINRLDVSPLNLALNGRAQDQWIRDEKETIIRFLRDCDLWKKMLYQTDRDSSFFLLNEETLSRSFLPAYYRHLEAC